MEKKSYTIKDIARLAKVSRGTVDRVLHDRGKVSEDALVRVKEVLEKINYEPNLIARSLKNSKDYYITVLMPEYKNDAYWKTCYKGIKDAAKEFKSYGISLELYFFSISGSESFLQKFEKIQQAKPDGLVLVPAFAKESAYVYETCAQRGIPVSTFNTPPSGGTDVAFVGQDMIQSGRLGAELLYLLKKDAQQLLIIHINDEAFENAVHLRKKEEGFRTYFADKTEVKISRLSIRYSDLSKQKAEIREYLLANPEISGIWVSSSKIFLVAELLDELGKDINLVGYDLIDKNIEHLKAGTIDFLINQNPRTQAFLAVNHIANKLAFQKDIPAQHLLPIDIVSRENLTFYLSSKRIKQAQV